MEYNFHPRPATAGLFLFLAGRKKQIIIIRMTYIHTLVLILKYVLAVAIVAIIIMAPVWIAANNNKNGYKGMLVRLANWLVGWTGIGWLVALFWASKK